MSGSRVRESFAKRNTVHVTVVPPASVYTVKCMYSKFVYCESEFSRYVHGWISGRGEGALGRESWGFVGC